MITSLHWRSRGPVARRGTLRQPACIIMIFIIILLEKRGLCKSAASLANPEGTSNNAIRLRENAMGLRLFCHEVAEKCHRVATSQKSAEVMDKCHGQIILFLYTLTLVFKIESHSFCILHRWIFILRWNHNRRILFTYI